MQLSNDQQHKEAVEPDQILTKIFNNVEIMSEDFCGRVDASRDISL